MRLHNEAGEMRGTVHVARVKAGNVQVHWPEGNVLLERGCRSPNAEIPDYNAVVWIEPLAPAGR